MSVLANQPFVHTHCVHTGEVKLGRICYQFGLTHLVVISFVKIFIDQEYLKIIISLIEFLPYPFHHLVKVYPTVEINRKSFHRSQHILRKRKPDSRHLLYCLNDLVTLTTVVSASINPQWAHHTLTLEHYCLVETTQKGITRNEKNIILGVNFLLSCICFGWHVKCFFKTVFTTKKELIETQQILLMSILKTQELDSACTVLWCSW